MNKIIQFVPQPEAIIGPILSTDCPHLHWCQHAFPLDWSKDFRLDLGGPFFLHRWLPETEKKEDAPCPGIKIFEATA
jgi:hypothetical protein